MSTTNLDSKKVCIVSEDLDTTTPNISNVLPFKPIERINKNEPDQSVYNFFDLNLVLLEQELENLSELIENLKNLPDKST